MLDKIFTTGSSTAFVHRRRYNQRKMKVPQGGLKSFFVPPVEGYIQVKRCTLKTA